MAAEGAGGSYGRITVKTRILPITNRHCTFWTMAGSGPSMTTDEIIVIAQDNAEGLCQAIEADDLSMRRCAERQEE